MARNLGIVKWFNKKQGYGFINVIDGEHKSKDIFVHYSSLRSKDSQYRFLIQGEYVEFKIDVAPKENHEYQAIDVTGVLEGLLMCETRQNAINTRPQRALSKPEVDSDDAIPVSATEDKDGFRPVIRHRSRTAH